MEIHIYLALFIKRQKLDELTVRYTKTLFPDFVTLKHIIL